MSAQVQALRSRASESDRLLLDELDATRTRLSSLMVTGPNGDRAQHAAKFAELDKKLAELESTLGARGTDASITPPDLAAVHRALPADSALVEFVKWRASDIGSKPTDVPAERYVAYVLTSSGTIAFTDLGEAAAIDRAVR
jgi:hypothetical protein